MVPAGPAVIINELVTDSTGSPDKEAFVELYGPAGTSLAGFSLVGINGNGGAEYNRIALTGVIPASGFYVVAHPLAVAGTLAVAQQTATAVDYQNGPDSVLLQRDGVTVDAVAYGVFTASDVFAGERSAAAAAPIGQSLGRDALQTDTDDNAADFALRAPSPGAANATQMMGGSLMAQLRCPSSVRVREQFLFDASGSTGTTGVYAYLPGDGSAVQTVMTSTLMYQYTRPGTFTASVTVRDAAGASARATCSILVVNQPPEAQVECPAMLGLGESGTFDASPTIEPDGETLSFSFRFSDGATLSSSSGVVMKSFPTAGTYTLTVTATDPGGLSDTATCSVRVADRAPVAHLACPATVLRGQSATYSAAASTDDTGITQFVFDFGDGTMPVSQTGSTISRAFATAGTFLVSLSVRDRAGQTATDSCIVVVEEGCGNNRIDPGEQCDDGNRTNNDGCSSSCVRECRPDAPNGGIDDNVAMGTYTRACDFAEYPAFQDSVTHHYSFTRSAPFSLNIDLYDSDSPCPQTQSCLFEGSIELYSGSTRIAAEGGPYCRDLTTSNNGQLRNVPAGTYTVVLFLYAGTSCTGFPYIMDLNFGPAM